MLTAHQRAQLGQVNLLLQLELIDNEEPEEFLDALLELLDRQNILEGNA